MIELARHIEILLVENDCVIIPEFGGFIVHYQPACYVETEHCFLPPMRTIGFNPQLKINDGLLAQSYMQTYHTDFPDASRMIAKKVKCLKEMLDKEGLVELKGIGHLKYNMHEDLIFQPSEAGVASPALYGLDSFAIEPLSNIKKPSRITPAQKKKIYQTGQRWLGNAVAAAAAVILFFFLSVPVENTYVDKGNYASLGTDELFSAIREQSLAATYVSPITNNQQQDNKKNLKPVAIRVEKVAKPVVETASTTQPIATAPVVKAAKVNTEMVAEAAKKPVAEAIKPAAEVAKPAAVKPAVVKPAAEKPAVVSAPVVTKKAVATAPVQKPAVQTRNTPTYHIIAASLTSMEDAKKVMKKFETYHFGNMKVIESKGRFRVSVISFSDKQAAYKKMNELKQTDAFKGAWLFTSK